MSKAYSEEGQHDRWTSLNIWLHWTIVVLIAVQYLVTAGGMEKMWDAAKSGSNGSGGLFTLGNAHIAVGSLVLIAAIIRLWDRFAHGRPPHPDGAPNWAHLLAKITHVLLYTFLIAMPIGGLLGWFLNSEFFAEAHHTAAEVLIYVIALHVLGALANHFWFKTDALRNMMPGRGR
ncbi:cytochrome b [Qipengyuania gelatinilytica]|uniref:Cytochrome b/b6 domain-containing protein n=1 Tax=Qipengyuania gelatinilytica TaxID=2867231 RepID=A0ABX9A7B2_9SPHN|nr:cytochrome b/b6 domain-containing protein [Qipengyuania gelatinilytica]QZD96149.1 cytochrome b/b6 domain-containing protein [Qipengyuania gelatinilytica]